MIQEKRIVIYCRVDQGGNPTQRKHVLAVQQEQLKRYAAFHGLQVAGYYEDAGYSGHDLNRPGLNQMLNDWKREKFDAVLIVNHTRLFRGSTWKEPSWPFPIISANDLDLVPNWKKR